MRDCIVVAPVAVWGIVIALVATGIASAGDSGKRLIELGWDQPTTEFLRANHREMEQAAPFDGVVFAFGKPTPDGGYTSHESIFGRTPIEREWLAPVVEDLRACDFRQFTDNFVRLNTAPGDLDFADDTAWETAASNLGHVAWMAREAGAKGICWDPECYYAKQWMYNRDTGRTIEEERELARLRGRQVMAAIAAEYPDVVILHLFGGAYSISAGRAEEPLEALPADNYGLWVSFFTGLVEAMPSTATMVDGNEHGYYGKSALDYLRLANDVRNATGPVAALMPDAVRGKYLDQIEAGSTLYLDAFTNPPDSTWYIGEADGMSRVERLRELLTAALEASDRYVWVYGERHRWWSDFSQQHLREAAGNEAGLKWFLDATKDSKHWEDVLPGVTDALWAARHPTDMALKAIDAGRGENLVVNGGFSAVLAPHMEASELPEWGLWQGDESAGRHALDGGSAQLTGVRRGCLMQMVPVTPRERYVVTGIGRRTGASASLEVAWRRPDKGWLHPTRYSATFSRPSDREGWQRAVTVVGVPEGAGYILLQCQVNNQADDQSAWFDDVGVYRWLDLMRMPAPAATD